MLPIESRTGVTVSVHIATDYMFYREQLSPVPSKVGPDY